MKKYIYAFKNIKSGQFGTPVYEVIDNDQAVEAYTAAAKECPEQEKARNAELDLYYLGTFETKTGVSDLVEPIYLLSLKEVIYGRDEKQNK